MNLKKFFQPAMAITFAFTLACTSCSTGPQLERDETAQATLDYKNNQIITPLIRSRVWSLEPRILRQIWKLQAIWECTIIGGL